MLRSIHLIVLSIAPVALFSQDSFTSNLTVRGEWNAITSWTSSGTDTDGIPDNDDEVTILSGDTIDLLHDQEVKTLTINNGGVLNHTNGNQIDVYGNYTNNGIQEGGNAESDLSFVTSGSILTGNGIIRNKGELKINANLTLSNFADLTIATETEINFDGAYTVTNNGTIAINDNLNGFSNCSWIQGTGAILKFGHNSTPLKGGLNLDCSTHQNTFIYNKNGNHDSIAPVTYHHLTIDISNTNKEAHLKNNIIVLGNLTINKGHLTTHAETVLTVTGTTIINTGGTLGFSDNATPINNLQAVTLNGGQLGRAENGTINCTSITCSVGSSSLLNRCNLNVSGNILVHGDLNANDNNGGKSITGNLTVSASGIWRSSGNESFTIGGTLTNNGTFSTGTGDYTFTGASNYFNDASGLLTFGDHLTINGSYTNNVTSLNVTGSLQGSGTLTNTANTSLTIGETASLVNLVATAIPNTVIYNGTVNQGAIETDYYNLTISNTGVAPNNEVNFLSGTNMHVANLINIISGTLDFRGVNEQITGKDVTMASGTNFKIRTSGTVSTIPQPTGTYTLAKGSKFSFHRNGVQKIANTISYQDIEFDGNHVKNLTGDLVIKGNLTIAGAAQVNTTTNNFNITLGGNWTSTSTSITPFIQNAGTVTLNGTGTQTINSTTIGGETFNNLVLSKPTGGVSLFDSTTVNSFLTLTTGILTSSTTGLLIFNDGAESNGGNAASFIDGPVKKIGNDPFTFPLGNGSTWARVAISAPSLITDGFTAQYFAHGFGDGSVTGALNNVSSLEYWTLDRDPETTSNVTVKLHFESTIKSEIDALNSDLVVARYNGTNWETEGQSAITAINPGSISSHLINSFSPFTFGSLSSISNPLPIELINFKAVKNRRNVMLNWSTLSEINNAYFTIEKSIDAENFKVLKTIQGTGNSSLKVRYSTTDDSPYVGTAYYRLKQTDFNGNVCLVKVIPFHVENFNFENYPNPIKDVLTIVVDQTEDKSDIEISAINGKMVYQKKLVSQNSLTIPTDDWEPGIYFISIKNSKNKKTVKIMK